MLKSTLQKKLSIAIFFHCKIFRITLMLFVDETFKLTAVRVFVFNIYCYCCPEKKYCSDSFFHQEAPHSTAGVDIFNRPSLK